MFFSSILLGFGVIFLFNDKVFAFVQAEELNEIIFGDGSGGDVRGGTPLSTILFVLDDIRHNLSVKSAIISNTATAPTYRLSARFVVMSGGDQLDRKNPDVLHSRPG